MSSLENLIAQKDAQIKSLKDEYTRTLNDEKLIPKKQEYLKQNDSRCPKQCGRFNGGNRSCRNHCDGNWYQSFNQNKELRNLKIKQHTQPILNRIKAYENEKAVLIEKSNIPLLRNEVIALGNDLSELNPLDANYRQSKQDITPALIEKSQQLDELERKHNMFGNLPQRTQTIQYVKPEPIINTIIETKTIQEPINNRLLLLAGLAGLGVLLIAWRLSK